MLTGCVNIRIEDTSGESPQTESKESTANLVVHDTDLLKSLTTKEEIRLDPKWEWAENSEINSGTATLYRAGTNRKNIVIAVNAGHGTEGGDRVRTYCHPDKSPKITSGSNPAGSLKATAISLGMTFDDGSIEAEVALKTARILRDILLEKGYDVLMLRDAKDVQLDNVARSVIANNVADCLISLHWDGDGLNYDKGCFCVPVPDEIKNMEPVASNWREHEKLGKMIIYGLRKKGCKIFDGKNDPLELTQTCYATIPSVLVELGNQSSYHEDSVLERLAEGIAAGIEAYDFRASGDQDPKSPDD